MKETPQRLRSYAPPTRDKIFIWSAVVAGCGIMALLGRHAAITRFGTDEFTGNVLFAVFFVLTIVGRRRNSVAELSEDDRQTVHEEWQI